MYRITKAFDFSYAHRVWDQSLNEKRTAGDSYPKCQRIHGHNGKVIVELEGKKLFKDQNVLLDYTELKFFKKILDEDFDHKFIIDINDPFLERFISIAIINEFKKDLVLEPYIINNTGDPWEDTFVIINDVPTSENLAKLFFKELQDYLADVPNVKVKSITFKEGDSTSATYSED